MPTFKPDYLAVVSLRAEDVPATAHFYRDVIGLSLMPHHGHRPAFELGNGCHLVIVQGQPVAQDPQIPRFPVIAFAVEDLAQAVEQLRAHNVEMPWGIEAGSGARWVEFYDPAGNLVELAQLE